MGYSRALSFPPASPPEAATSHRPGMAAIFGLVLLVALPPRPAAGCVGPPPEPLCTKTLQLAIAGPPVILLPSGGSFDVSALIYFGLWDFPAGSGICPAGPYTADISITATCAPTGADGSGQLLGATLGAGYNELTVPVTVPAGPPRRCVLDAVATLSLADGMVLTESADNVACLGDPAPGMPAEPRLDLRLVGAPGEEIARVYPGDPVGFVYEIVNNAPTESYQGTLTADSLNESRMPGSSGPMPPGTAVISVSDPAAGENFPLELLPGRFDLLDGEPVAEGCIALPPDPTDPGIPVKTLSLELAAGASTFVTLRSRPWGLCADGSCGRSTLNLEGAFSDGSRGLACSGIVTAADTSRTPGHACEDAGEVVRLPPPPDPRKLTSTGSPRAGVDVEIDTEVTSVSLTEDGAPAAPAIPFSGVLDAHRGRVQLQFAETFAVDSFFDITLEITFAPGPGGAPITTEVVALDLVGAPTGFETSAPFAAPLVRLEDDPTAALVGFFQPEIQLSAVAIDNLGGRRPLSFGGIDFVPLAAGAGLRGTLSGGRVTAGPGTSLDAIEIAMDLRGFLSSQPQGELIFEDGFESGNVSRWSASTP